MKLCLALPLVLASLTYTGCAPKPGNFYSVLIDPGFDLTHQDQIVDAVTDWQTHVPLRAPITIEHCSGISNQTICIHASTRAAITAASHGLALARTVTCAGLAARGLTAGVFGVDGGEVWLNVEDTGSVFQEETVHELGHAMGLEHDPDYGTVMYPVDDGTAWLVTPADAEQWRALRF